MIISVISLLLLVVAAYFLIKTKPNLFLFELMSEVFGEATDNSKSTKESQNKKSCSLNPPQ